MAYNSEVLDVCFAFLDLRTIGRASVASKACRALAPITLRQNTAKLLPQAISAYSHCPQAQNAEAGVHWVLKYASTEALKGLGGQLLTIPRLPPACCKLLVAAGVRISWEQLAAAARSRVAGIEVWVLVQSQLGHASNLPAIAVALCTPAGDIIKEMDHLRPEQLADVLHVAVNLGTDLATDPAGIVLRVLSSVYISAPRMSAVQHQRLKAALSALLAAEVDSLLATALQRGHSRVIPHLEELPQQRLLPAASIADWLREAAEAGREDELRSLLRTKSAKQLDPAAVLAVLEAAVEQHIQQQQQQQQLQQQQQQPQQWSTGRCISDLARDYSTAAVDTGRLAGLIGTALQHGNADAMRALCSMQAAQQCDTAVVAGWYDTAMQQQQPKLGQVRHLLRLLAAHQQADKQRILAFLQAAVQQKDGGALVFICNLPAAQQQLTATEAGAMLKDAITSISGFYGCFYHLPAIQQLEPGVVSSYLVLAIQQQQAAAVQVLYQLAGAQQLEPSAISSLLVLAMQQQQAAAVKLLCKLPGAQQLDEQQVSEVLQAAAVQAYLPSLQLPAVQEAARQLSAGDFEELVQQVLEGNIHNGHRSLKWLWALDNAQQLDPTAVMRLINCSAQYQQSSEAAEWLCDLPAAQQLPAAAVSQLLRFATNQHHQRQQQQPTSKCLPKIVGWLALLPGAQQLDAAAVQQLLVLAVKQGALGVLRQIVQRLPVARSIDAAAVQQLKQVAEERGVSKSCVSFIKSTWKHVK